MPEIFRYPFLAFARVVIVVLGLFIAYYALEGYRKVNRQPMLWLSIGFVLLSLSMVVQGIIFEFQLFGNELESIFTAMYVQTVIMALGMVSVLYSLFCRE